MRDTVHLYADNAADVERAAEILRAGGLVAFATETVYGLGANALSEAAVAGIFSAKGRPAWDPLIVHVVSIEQMQQIANVEGELARRVGLLAEAFWPGPLTMLLPRTAVVPDAVTAGRPLVGVRVPGHPAALALLRAAGVPVAAPSANRFGHVSPTTAEHVLADLEGRIDAVLDAGACAVGVESTVLEVGVTPMVVYRAGAVTLEAIEAVSGVSVEMFVAGARSGEPEALPSPGVGLRHYAPEAEVRLSEGGEVPFWALVEEARGSGRRVGVLLPSNWALRESAGLVVQRWGRWDEDGELTAGLFAGLRALEKCGVAILVCPLPEPGGVREALRDRLMKAAKAR